MFNFIFKKKKNNSMSLFINILLGILIFFSLGCGAFDDAKDKVSGNDDDETPSTSRSITGSVALSSALQSSSSDSEKKSREDSASVQCGNYRLYFIPSLTGEQGEDYYQLADNADGGCDLDGTLPEADTYDIQLFSKDTDETFSVFEADVLNNVEVDKKTSFEATIEYDYDLKIVKVTLVKIDGDGKREEVKIKGNKDDPNVQKFPDISGSYTFKLKQSSIDKFQKDEEDEVDEENKGGWEEDFYVVKYLGNLFDENYQEIDDTESYRVSFWTDKKCRDNCYELNGNSDVIKTYSMQASASAAASEILTITENTTVEQVYDFLSTQEWLPAATLTEFAADSLEDAADEDGDQEKDIVNNVGCESLMAPLIDLYKEATFDGKKCTAFPEPESLLDNESVLSLLAKIPADIVNVFKDEFLLNDILNTNSVDGPPHQEWCQDYNIFKGNEEAEEKFKAFITAQCEMHMSDELEDVEEKIDIVRQFFDIFAEIRREPKSDKKTAAMSDFIKDNDITSSNFATKMADDSILKGFLTLIIASPCEDEGCKIWKNGLKYAYNNLDKFKDGTLCDGFSYSENNICFTLSQFTAQATTIDIQIIKAGSTYSMIYRIKTGSTWGDWATTPIAGTANSYTYPDETGVEQNFTEVNFTFEAGGNTYDIYLPGDRDNEIYGNITSNGQTYGLGGEKLKVEENIAGISIVYRAKSGGGMAEQIDSMACQGGEYYPVEFKEGQEDAAEVSAIMNLQLPRVNGPMTYNEIQTALSGKPLGDWYKALVDLYQADGVVASGCGKINLKDAINSIYWSLQVPGMYSIYEDPDNPTINELETIQTLLNNFEGEEADLPGSFNPSGDIIDNWDAIKTKLARGSLQHIFWVIFDIQRDLGLKKIKKMFASKYLYGTKTLKEMTADDMASFLAELQAADKDYRWSWIWAKDERGCYETGGTCEVLTSTDLAAEYHYKSNKGEGGDGYSRLEDVKHRLEDARKRYALEEDATFKQKMKDIIANSKCIPDLSISHEPVFDENKNIIFKMTLRSPAYRIVDGEIRYKKDKELEGDSALKYIISSANLERESKGGMTSTCVFGEKKEMRAIPLPAANTEGKYELNGNFLKAFFDGCNSDDNMKEVDNVESSTETDGEKEEIGIDRYREIQAFKAVQQ